jgi:DNA (cytosine-5)-methyltransferase 1
MLTFIDLFAGVGGMHLAFPGKCVFANDSDLFCKITYDANFTPHITPGTIESIESSSLPDFDFLIGGFPCQPFSIAGYQEGFNDRHGRGNVFYKIADILEVKKPVGFLLENVSNLQGHDGGNTFRTMLGILDDKGYEVHFKVMNTKHYGNLPQNRARIYIVGFRKSSNVKFVFPQPLPLNTSVSELLEHDVDNKYYYEGKPLYDYLKDEVYPGGVYQWRRKYVRRNAENISPCMTANMGGGGHNVPIIHDGIGIRKLTPRECFRLQGFPDSFILPKIADSRLYKQAGNSVSVPVIRAIANNIHIAAFGISQ